MTAPVLPLGSPPAVRLGLVLDTPHLPAWAAAVLGEASRDGTVALAGVALLGVELLGGSDARATRSARPPLGARLYLAADARRYVRRDDPARPVDFAAALPGVACLVLAPAALDPSGAVVLPNDPALVAWGADLVWYLGARPLASPTPALAAGGVWTLDPPAGAGGARAMADARPATVTRLCRLTGARREVLACVRTSTHRISPTANRAEHLRHLAVAIRGWLRRASRFGPAALRPLDEVDPPGAAPAGALEAPLSTRDAVRVAARATARLVRARLPGGMPARQWQLAFHFDATPDDVRRAPAAGHEGVPETDLGAFTRVPTPPGRYWADPFPVEHEGRRYVFFEEHLAGRAEAHLSVAEFDRARGLVNPRVVLARDYHLSFPSVFHSDGAWYMTPEASTTGTVPLYRATSFPDAWAYVADLVAGARFVDPVVTCLAGVWWLFAGVMPPGTEEATALHLYHAPTLLGPWTPHVLNPVAVDVHGARPAGRVFAHGGRYYRPVQDGAPYYGRAMTLRRIDTLTPTSFAETAVARLEPDLHAGLVGAHTLNAAGRLTMTDLLGLSPGSA